MKALIALGMAFCFATVACAQRSFQEDQDTLSRGPIPTTKTIEELRQSLVGTQSPTEEDLNALAKGKPITITKTIEELSLEYRDTIVSMMEILRNRYLDGSDAIDELLRAQVLLVQAELMIAKTAEDRLTAIKQYVVSAQMTEVYQQARAKVGTGRLDELAKAKAAARKAEIMYLEELRQQERAGEGPLVPTPEN